MYLPEYVSLCLSRLEQAGFSCYAVGGCVRDALLGLRPHDYDLCTNATPNQIRQVFFDHRLVLAGEKHGTVGVITDGGVVEITTFRTESGYRDNRHPDRVEFVTRPEADLARRDFTVNAMAWSPTRGLADPYGGEVDLKNRVLRAVGDPTARFQEDALRILRGVRFAVRFRLTPEPATLRAMVEQRPLLAHLARERVFDELCKLLPFVSAQDLIAWAPILTQVIPELAPCVSFDQRSPHHVFDLYAHIAHVTQAVPPELPLRWAALLHDIGKPATFTLDENGVGHFYGHASLSAQMADEILLRLKAPTRLRQQVIFLIEKHMTPLTPDRKLLRRRLSQYGEAPLRQLLWLQEADRGGKEEVENASAVRDMLDALLRESRRLTLRELAVNGHDLIAMGLTGKDIGTTLERLLGLVLDEAVPNDRQALLTAADRIKKEIKP